jgi:hypothetical protein
MTEDFCCTVIVIPFLDLDISVSQIGLLQGSGSGCSLLFEWISALMNKEQI